MLRAVRAAKPDARIDGFTVQSMVRRPHAQEVIVGASIDSVFGPVILCGQGGTAVEITADSAVALPPLNRSLARELVSRTRVSRLLAGYRDHPPAKVDALYDVLIAVSQMLADLPQLAELDINPLYVDEAGAIALDARIRVSEPAGRRGRALRDPSVPFAMGANPGLERPRDHGAPIRPEDEAQHRQFIEKLDPEDVRMRIFQTRRELPHSELARLTQIDYDREMALIAEAVDAQGVPETLGVARTVSDPDHVEAEFAIIVRSDLKGAGLGTLLLDRLIEHARSRGIGRLVGIVLRENTRMLKLARALGFKTDPAEPMGSEVRRVIMSLDSAARDRETAEQDFALDPNQDRAGRR